MGPWEPRVALPVADRPRLAKVSSPAAAPFRSRTIPTSPRGARGQVMMDDGFDVSSQRRHRDGPELAESTVGDLDVAHRPRWPRVTSGRNLGLNRVAHGFERQCPDIR